MIAPPMHPTPRQPRSITREQAHARATRPDLWPEFVAPRPARLPAATDREQAQP